MRLGITHDSCVVNFVLLGHLAVARYSTLLNAARGVGASPASDRRGKILQPRALVICVV